MHRNLSTLALTVFFCTTVRDVSGQTASPREADRKGQPTRQERGQVTAQESASRPELYRLRRGHYVYPAPYSPDTWSPHIRPYYDYDPGRRRSGLRGRRSSLRYGRRGGSRYRHDPYAAYGYGPYGGHVGAAYEQGRYDADHEYLWYIAAQRAGRLLNQHKEIFDEGLIMFRDGRYDWAAIRLLGAAEKNHSSAASRLHAGHAVFALGRYDDATRLISRAFELAPSLAHKPYDIREEYGKKGDFDRHLAALRSYVRRRPNEAGAVTLLGYVTFYSEGPGAAYPYLRQAARLDPESYFIPKLLTSARLASGMEPQRPSAQRAGSPRQAGHRPNSAGTRIRRVGATDDGAKQRG